MTAQIFCHLPVLAVQLSLKGIAVPWDPLAIDLSHPWSFARSSRARKFPHFLNCLFACCNATVCCRQLPVSAGALQPEAAVRLLPAADVHPLHPHRRAVLGLLLDQRRGRPGAHLARRHHRAHHDDAAQWVPAVHSKGAPSTTFCVHEKVELSTRDNPGPGSRPVFAEFSATSSGSTCQSYPVTLVFHEDRQTSPTKLQSSAELVCDSGLPPHKSWFAGRRDITSGKLAITELSN